jgi:hypothetical protein
MIAFIAFTVVAIFMLMEYHSQKQEQEISEKYKLLNTALVQIKEHLLTTAAAARARKYRRAAEKQEEEEILHDEEKSQGNIQQEMENQIPPLPEEKLDPDGKDPQEIIESSSSDERAAQEIIPDDNPIQVLPQIIQRAYEDGALLEEKEQKIQEEEKEEKTHEEENAAKWSYKKWRKYWKSRRNRYKNKSKKTTRKIKNKNHYKNK